MNRIVANATRTKSFLAASVLALAAACLTENNPVDTCTDSNECPVDRPYCSPELGGCVPCTANVQCESRAETPVCNVGSGECVACVDNAQCSGDTPTCDTETFTCVGCLSDEECTDPRAARCDPETQACVSCTENTQCQGIEGLSVCNDEGDCVQCTVQDELPCGDDSCDPATLTCTDTERGSVGVCAPCVADSECGDGMGNESETHRCIPLNFMGTPQGGRCLEERADTVPECQLPYFPLIDRQSLSGEPPTEYCGIDEDLTTCEAVLRGSAANTCTPETVAEDCAPDGALCENIGGGLFCTYPCDADIQCPEGKPACLGGFCTTPP